MKRGTRVQMSEGLKRRLRGKCGEVGKHLGPFDPGGGTPEDPGGACWGCSSDHVDEFGACVGVVQGPTFPKVSDAPEVDVLWEPSQLRYAYLPEDLVEEQAPASLPSEVHRTGEQHTTLITSWRAIDRQVDLNELDRAVSWEDSRVLEYLAGLAPRPYYPPDVSRSGHEYKDVHVLLETSGATAPFLELVFIHCDWIGENALEMLCLHGHVDTLRRVELRTPDGTILLRCARLVYRWLAEASITGNFYRSSREGDQDGTP